MKNKIIILATLILLMAVIMSLFMMQSRNESLELSNNVSIDDLYESKKVVENPSITVLSPNGEEVWHRDEQKMIEWMQSNFTSRTIPPGVLPPPDGITIFINTDPVDSAADVQLRKFIGESGSNTDSYNWTVGSVRNDSIPNGTYYIKVCRRSSICDWSDSSFTIID